MRRNRLSSSFWCSWLRVGTGLPLWYQAGLRPVPGPLERQSDLRLPPQSADKRLDGQSRAATSAIPRKSDRHSRTAGRWRAGYGLRDPGHRCLRWRIGHHHRWPAASRRKGPASDEWRHAAWIGSALPAGDRPFRSGNQRRTRFRRAVFRAMDCQSAPLSTRRSRPRVSSRIECWWG